MKENTCAEVIGQELSRRDLLENLAEEAAELAKAALKAIRAEKLNGNATVQTAEEAEENLKEEFMDVLIVAEVLGMTAESVDEAKKRWKWARWISRLHKEKMGVSNGI